MRIYEATRRFPTEERFGLSCQLRRAAVSVGANIAEGAARPSQLDYVRFLVLAYGSAREIEYELSIARRLNNIEHQVAIDLEAIAARTCAALYGLIRALRPTHTSR
jgi:four helix bundle protein